MSAPEFKSELSACAQVSVHGVAAAIFSKHSTSTGEPRYEVTYLKGYRGPAISLTMPVREEPYQFDRFPPFFDGLLPEGLLLEGLLRQAKIDKHDYFRQLLAVGADLVGAVTIDEALDGNVPLPVVGPSQQGAP